MLVLYFSQTSCCFLMFKQHQKIKIEILERLELQFFCVSTMEGNMLGDFLEENISVLQKPKRHLWRWVS